MHFADHLLSLAPGDPDLSSDNVDSLMDAFVLVKGMAGVGEKCTTVQKFIGSQTIALAANDLVKTVASIAAAASSEIDLAKVSTCIQKVPEQQFQELDAFQKNVDGFLVRCIGQLLQKALS